VTPVRNAASTFASAIPRVLCRCSPLPTVRSCLPEAADPHDHEPGIGLAEVVRSRCEALQ
jgi:hypothetical protein